MKNKKIISCIVAVLLICIFVFSFSGCDVLSSDDSFWVNRLSSLGMQAAVRVYAKSYNTDYLGRETTRNTLTGSGVIFKRQNNTYTLLTNNHVVKKQDDYSFLEVYIHDYVGTEYSAEVIACDPTYDLAVLTFDVPIRLNESPVIYTPLSFAAADPNASTRIAAIGNPKGQINCLTLGKVIAYGTSHLTDSTSSESHVTFDVIFHSAPINTGSSGGALINQAMNVVGINYGTSIDENGNFVQGCAIPISKVKEYLSKNNISLN